MKRISLIFLAFILLSAPLFAPSACALTQDELLSHAVMLVDAKTGEILFSKNPDERLSMASTTKIMTLILSIEMSSPDEIVTVPQCVEDIGLNSTRVPVYYGEVMPLQDLWYGLIFKSGNDAANAIAHHEAGSVEAFVKMMNDKALSIGMTNTQFMNPHGYTQTGHYTTARDMSKLALYCLSNDLFREITFGDVYTMQPTSLRPALTIYHNYAINDYDSMYYYQYSRGVKTGYTAAAGQCYVGAAIKDGREIVVVMLRCGWEKFAKWPEAKKLYQYGFELLESRQ
ncbi:MAG: D-alanyl-D-alanine carboxypeptidase [Clostridia bacterium]|nr:D-alanyl-D-alanine carboxypeptidase [Clostridia bacterium]